jgi:hypothetical protein
MTNERAVAWMAEIGRPGYANRIKALREQLAAATPEQAATIEAEIAAIEQEAYDRYDDWKTDMLD